jgi:hypothetical protein
MGKADDNLSAAERFRDSAGRIDTDDEMEEQLWQGRYSGKAMVGYWAGSVVVIVLTAVFSIRQMGIGQGLLTTIVVGIVVWGALFLLLTYRKLANSYLLTTQRFIHKEGILRQVSDRIEVIDMDDVTYEQTIIDRMLSVGTIRITSSDRSHPKLSLRGIDDVQRIADLIDDVRRKERRKRSLHIETI